MRRPIFCLLLLGALLISACSNQRPTAPELAPDLFGTLYLPDPIPGAPEHAFPAVVILHGSGGMRPVYHEEAQLLNEQGFAALVLDYYGLESYGGLSSEERARRWRRWQDMTVAAVEYLQDHPRVDAQRIALVGFSQGAALAVTSAHRLPQLRAIVDFFGPHVEEWYVEVFFNQKKVLPEDYLDHMPPTLILHGSRDPIVSINESRRLYQQLQARSKDVELQEYAGSLHALNDPAGDSEEARRVADHARARMVSFLNTRVRDYRLRESPPPDWFDLSD